MVNVQKIICKNTYQLLRLLYRVMDLCLIEASSTKIYISICYHKRLKSLNL